MPYTLDNPPDAVKGLPKHAIEIYVAAFNAALEQYKDEGKASAVAWSAVKSKYEKKDDKWVAKEAGELRQADRKAIEVNQLICPSCSGERFEEVEGKLKCCDCGLMVEAEKIQRDLFADIIQEAGKRGYLSDSEQVKKAIDNLSSEFTFTGIMDAYATLDWVKQQPITKTEDGLYFPIEAFAYNPDSQNPGGWKLRIWESPDMGVTKAQLGKAAAALSPGGFRGQRVDIPASDLPAVKRKLRAAYRSLDIEDMPRSVKEATMQTKSGYQYAGKPEEARKVFIDFQPLTEAKINGKGTAQLTIIQPGFNASKERYYPMETLSRDYSVFEGVKMYADHPTEEDERLRPERSIKDWVATLKNVRMENGVIVGDAEIVEPWMKEKLATLRDKGMLQEMGISINAVGSASVSEIEGVKTNVIEKIIRARSVDFVTEPGAGGRVEVYESVSDLDIDLVNISQLKEHRPDLVKEIEETIKSETIKEVQKAMELENKVKELEESNANLLKENEAMKADKEAAEKAKRIAEAKSLVDEAVSKAELPEPAKNRILDKFKDVESAEGLEEAVKAEQDYIAAITESGKVKGMGKKPETTTDINKMKEAVKAAHPDYTDEQVEAFITR